MKPRWSAQSAHCRPNYNQLISRVKTTLSSCFRTFLRHETFCLWDVWKDWRRQKEQVRDVTVEDFSVLRSTLHHESSFSSLFFSRPAAGSSPPCWNQDRGVRRRTVWLVSTRQHRHWQDVEQLGSMQCEHSDVLNSETRLLLTQVHLCTSPDTSHLI